MKISGIGASFPPSKISNQDAVQVLEKESKDRYNFDLGNNRSLLIDKLDSTGIINRYRLAENENKIDLISDAVQKALDDASMIKKDIDLIIYSSVFKQFIEPGESFFIAKALGFKDVECFDVLEACNSFVRASSISESYLKTDKYKTILIITAEFTSNTSEFQTSYALKNEFDLAHVFSSLTIGAGASATILTKNEQNWEQEFVAKPQHADFCYMPISRPNDYELDLYGINEKDFVNYNFVSYGLKLHKEGYHTLKNMILKNIEEKGINDIVLPHSHSVNVWNKLNKELGDIIPYYHIYPEYGNLVTGSFPSALYLAKKEGKLKRGMKVGAWMAAAGMSLSITNFKF